MSTVSSYRARDMAMIVYNFRIGSLWWKHLLHPVYHAMCRVTYFQLALRFGHCRAYNTVDLAERRSDFPLLNRSSHFETMFSATAASL